MRHRLPHQIDGGRAEFVPVSHGSDRHDRRDDCDAPGEPSNDDELHAILDQIEDAGLVEVYIDADDEQALRFTSEDERVARQLLVLGEDGQDELMAALLEARRSNR